MSGAGVLAIAMCARLLPGQASVTASRQADLQVGVLGATANPDYAGDRYSLYQPTAGEDRWSGYGVYVDLDVARHWGIEGNLHRLSGPDPVLYEHTYEVGARYLYPIRERIVPYARVMVGRGIFNFGIVDPATKRSEEIANLAFNTQSYGGGLDVRMLPWLNVRLVDYEFQHWNSFPPNRLHPQVFSFGVAYHFPGERRR